MHAKRLLKYVALAALVVTAAGIGACGRMAQRGAVSPGNAHPAKKTLRAFGSEKELSGFLQGLADQQQRERERQLAQAQAQPGYGGAPPPP